MELFLLSEELARNGGTEDELERLPEHHFGPCSDQHPTVLGPTRPYSMKRNENAGTNKCPGTHISDTHYLHALQAIASPTFPPSSVVAYQHPHDRAPRFMAKSGGPESLESEVPRLEVSLLELIGCVGVIVEGL